MSVSEKNKQASKQGYLYLLEKSIHFFPYNLLNSIVYYFKFIETLGNSARVKQFCKYYKETKRLEVTPYNQLTNKYVKFY